MEEQIECIIYNLKKCKIKHFDMHPSGKNICLNKRGIISIIDFDMVSINNKSKPVKDEITNADEKDIANDFDKDSYYIELKEKIISIISDFCTIEKKENKQPILIPMYLIMVIYFMLGGV